VTSFEGAAALRVSNLLELNFAKQKATCGGTRRQKPPSFLPMLLGNSETSLHGCFDRFSMTVWDE
jgi:hypothetical protein